MLLLDVKHGDAMLVQGFVRCRWPTTENIRSGSVGTWARLFVRSAMLWSQLRPLSAGLRVTACPGQPLETLHCFVVDKTQERRLRLVLAAFLRTHEIGGAEAEAPQQQADLKGVYVHPGEQRIALNYETIRTGSGVRINYNLRLAQYLPQIVQNFVDLGMPIAYEAQVTPWSPPRELLRQALYDAAHLQDTPSAPADLVRDQTSLAQRLRTAAQPRGGYHVEECLASPLPQDLNALTDSLANILADTIYGRFGASPEPVVLNETDAAPFAHHVHTHLMNGTPEGNEPVAAAALKDEVDGLLSVQALKPDSAAAGDGGPPPAAEPLFATLTSSVPVGPAAAGGSAPGPGNGGPFLFVSYARADSDFVYPLIEKLAGLGVSTWIDRKITGGEDWAAELETRLIGCSGVLAVVTPSFVSSKYCVREVHFADALNRPIMPVFQQPVELKGAINFILHSIQRIMISCPDDYEAIIAAIRKHAPTTVDATKH
jgi:hypothetical protein